MTIPLHIVPRLRMRTDIAPRPTFPHTQFIQGVVFNDAHKKF